LGFTYTYDSEGNRLTKTETATGKVTSYEWDYRNRLTSVKDRTISGGAIVKQVDYQYDAMNRLVRRDFDADGAGAGVATSQFWVYDQGINAVLQFDGSGASNLTHRYLWSNAVDEIFADEQLTSPFVAGNVLDPLSDHLGTPRDIADLNEGTGVTSVTNHRRYDSFGKLISETNTAVDLIFGFTGKQLDEATGLQHNLNRWYDAALGQWVSEDPISFNAGDTNTRRYVSNDPNLFSDALGLQQGGTAPTGPGGSVQNYPYIPIPVPALSPLSPVVWIPNPFYVPPANSPPTSLPPTSPSAPSTSPTSPVLPPPLNPNNPPPPVVLPPTGPLPPPLQPVTPSPTNPQSTPGNSPSQPVRPLVPQGPQNPNGHPSVIPTMRPGGGGYVRISIPTPPPVSPSPYQGWYLSVVPVRGQPNSYQPAGPCAHWTTNPLPRNHPTPVIFVPSSQYK
jgi:RHS repeat-associated protein